MYETHTHTEVVASQSGKETNCDCQREAGRERELEINLTIGFYSVQSNYRPLADGSSELHTAKQNG